MKVRRALSCSRFDHDVCALFLRSFAGRNPGSIHAYPHARHRQSRGYTSDDATSTSRELHWGHVGLVRSIIITVSLVSGFIKRKSNDHAAIDVTISEQHCK